MTEKSEETAVHRFSGKGVAETGAADTESPERTAAVELGGGTGMGVAAADQVTIKVPGRDADGLRDRLPVEGK